MKNVLLLALMRLGSARLPGKMLKKVGASSLADIALAKLKVLREMFADTEQFDASVGLWAGDFELIQIAHRYSCPIIYRSEVSVQLETISAVYGEIGDFITSRYKRLVCINCCLPFLGVKTIYDFIKPEVDNPDSFVGSRAMVKRRAGFVWDQDEVMIHGGRLGIDTKIIAPYYSLTHALYSYRASDVGQIEMADYRNIAHVPCNDVELLDIDTREDYDLVNRVFRGEITTHGTDR